MRIKKEKFEQIQVYMKAASIKLKNKDLTKEDSINQAILELKAADKITQDFILNNPSL
jgi:hypothetical protein